MKDVTFIIKTLERFYCVKRLVKSIYKYYPNAIVLIGDDSEESCKKYFEKKYSNCELKVYDLPKDCGLSYGRNFLVKKVKTKYFVLLDDDFVFDKKTNILKGIEILEKKKLDILGGFFRNYSIVNRKIDYLKVILQNIIKWERPYNYIGSISYDETNKILYCNYITNDFPEYVDTDITHNFFIAKTCSILTKNLWDADLKLQEHTAFFYEAKKENLKVGFTNYLSVQHKPIKMTKYNSFRDRDFVSIFMKKKNIEKIISTFNDDPNTKIERVV